MFSSASNGIGLNAGTRFSNPEQKISSTEYNSFGKNINYVAYKSIPVPIAEFGIDIPVAVWYPVSPSDVDKGVMENFDGTRRNDYKPAIYNHRISLSKIGMLLAGWNLPSFLRKEYRLKPTLNKEVGTIVVDGDGIEIPTEDTRMILLAHGYLGSRFDLSHLAETLALDGFTCISAEYPESLSASYNPISSEYFNRSFITDRILDYFLKELNISPKSSGIIGHSLGCGTVVQTGDSSWTRVCIAGGFRGDPRIVGEKSPVLIISSINDGAVTYARVKDTIPKDFISLNENSIVVEDDESITQDIPRRSSFLFEGSESPNHISFLSGNVNDCMIDFLSPVLPLALMLGIPVLDFDRYKVSQDSDRTAKITLPVIKRFLKQSMT